ncbi:dystroglycan 1-like [Panonychus citri]|uniref:dystroglycan 1-like n=1 Tax=Panonychus citri TaxID=50023 RepID=UPI0023080876|nr:dystroglycan 1-like [Panonychus citri]XP_053214847.1 dystroglycan 1-like [Panonychus citri]
MPGSVYCGSILTISRCNLFSLLLIFLLINFPTVKSFSSSSVLSNEVDNVDPKIQMPDQTCYINKLCYYRLPISPIKFGLIKNLTIKEIGQDGLPKWLIFRLEKDHWELIGFPQENDKGLAWFILETVTKNDTKISDVFNVEITGAAPTNYHISPVNWHERQCTIRVVPKFNSILDVWNTIYYLIPSRIKEEIRIASKLVDNSNLGEDNDDPNFIMARWSYPNFVIKQTDMDIRSYQLAIEYQYCSPEHPPSDEFHLKLKKLGLDFQNIIIEEPRRRFREVSDRPIGEFSIAPNSHSEKIVPLSANNDKVFHPRELPSILPTPSLYPDFMTISSTLTNGNPDDYKLEPSTLSREVPTLTSPSAFPSSVYPDSLPSATPRMPDSVNTVGGNDFSFHPKLYTTPTPTIEPPSIYDGLSTPTPILPSIKLSDLSSSLVIPDIGPIVSSSNDILPTQSLDLNIITKSNTIEDEFTVKPPRPEITVNSRPELRARIPKLAPIAGKYWTFKIPDNTFIDREDGLTDKLRLGFTRVRSSMKDKSSKDFWIQFDAENQVLTAFPTDDDVGIYENQFYLEAVDSGGLSNYENITIHVRQHTSYRKFPYNITFYRVYWDPLRITTTIEALRNFAQIISQVNGDFNIDSFIVQHLTKETIDGKDYWTIVSTNDSIPAYPCPTKKIQQLYNRLADKPSKGQYALPSELLTSKMSKMFTIEGVGLSISCSKPNTAAEKPELRNAIDELRFRLGEVFRYKIAENMFYSGRGRNTYNLEISLYDGFGRVPAPDSFVKFNEKTFEIIGLAEDRKYIRENEFNLVARDRESENEASDAFVIVIEDPWIEEEISFTVTIGITLNDKIDIEDKLDIAHRISTIMFKDPDTSSLRILKIVKRDYTLMQSGYYTGTDAAKNPNLSDVDDEENTIERSKRSEPYDNSIDEGSIHTMYEYVWTNKTEPLLAKGGECPSTDIQDYILSKLFQPESNFETWDEKFADKYRVMSIEFKPVGKCSNYMTNREMYRDNMKPNIIPEKDLKSQPNDNVNYGQPASKDYEVHANELDDYYLRTIIPAIGTVAILLVVLCVIVCILVKCRKDIDKNRFDMTIRPGIDGYPTEVDAFIQKGRRPVILQSDYQQHLPMNSMMVTYNPVRQQTYSMANVNKNSYHALAHAVEQQRRQPPPYR